MSEGRHVTGRHRHRIGLLGQIIGIHLVIEGQEQVMAALDTIKDALATAKVDASAEHDEVMAALGEATAAIAALQAKVDELTAGAVTQEEIDAVAADAADVDAAIKSIYTAPVVEPPVA